MYLLDTNVISELRRTRPHGAVLEWLAGVTNADLNISSVTIGEIQAGIEATRGQDEAKAGEIELWLDGIAKTFNVISMDASSFRCWARLKHRKATELSEDAMIASIALVHDLTIVTRNVKHFQDFGVRVINPFNVRD